MPEPGKSAPQKKERRLEKQIEVAASAAQVWKALTEPAELAKWFPLEARVTAGEHGKICLSWGEDWPGEGEIVVWQPGTRLAWKDNFALVEFILEARGAKTVLRLVQSGFLGNEDWATKTGKMNGSNLPTTAGDSCC
jgi:uncharacterized protein YndB with AHSA1/START domain